MLEAVCPNLESRRETEARPSGTEVGTDKPTTNVHTSTSEAECRGGGGGTSDDGPFLTCFPKCLTLGTCTVLGCLVGVLVGLTCNVSDSCSEDLVTVLGYPGELWIRGLKLLVLPLMCSMMILIPSQAVSLGSLGVRACALYLLTSVFATMEGLFWVNIIRPGEGVGLEVSPDALPSHSKDVSVLDTLLNIGRQLVPSNIVDAMLHLNVLGLIFFFGGFGVLLQHVDDQPRRTVLDVAEAMSKSTFLAVDKLVKFTPLGMASTVAAAVSGTENLGRAAKALGKYCGTVVLGHFFHTAVFYLFLHTFYMAWVSKRSAAGCRVFNPFGSEGYFARIWLTRQAPLTAFATSSSAATLPVTLKVCQSTGISAGVANFVLPLGAAVNLDGSALGFPVMVMFGAQIFGVSVPFATQIAVGAVGIVCSIGTAPIPNAGLVYLVLLLSTAGGALDTPDVQKTVLALIISLDWFVDRVETAVNVFSDCLVVHLLDQHSKAPKEHEETSNEAETVEASAEEPHLSV